MVGSLDKGESNRIAELANGTKMIIARTYSMKDLSNELGITTAELNKGAEALSKYNIEETSHKSRNFIKPAHYFCF